MRRLATALLLASACASPSRAGDYHVLTSGGLGRVAVGMNLKQAQTALGAKLKVDYPEAVDNDNCGLARRADGHEANVLYMVEGGRITHIDVVMATSRTAPRVLTKAGVGLGASEAAVRRAYGRALSAEPHPYDEGALYLKIDEPGKRRGIIFEITQGKVSSFRAGRYPSLGYIEGCLQPGL